MSEGEEVADSHTFFSVPAQYIVCQYTQVLDYAAIKMVSHLIAAHWYLSSCACRDLGDTDSFPLWSEQTLNTANVLDPVYKAAGPGCGN